MSDLVDSLPAEWDESLPNQDFSTLGVVARTQLLAKLLTDGTEAALEDMGLKHWGCGVLSAPRRQGRSYQMNATERADASTLTSGTITTRADGLKGHGLVWHRASPADRRAVLIELTPEGRELIDRAVGPRLHSANRQLECLSA